MLRGTGGWRAAWRARLPDAIGTAQGRRRPLLSAWPFLLIAGFAVVTTLVVLPLQGPSTPLAVALAGCVGVPALLARHRPLAAGIGSVVVNLVLTLVATLAVLPPLLAPWFLYVAPPQLAAVYVIGLAMPAGTAVRAVAAILLSGVVFGLTLDQQSGSTGLWAGIPPGLVTWAPILVVAGMAGARHKDQHARTLRAIADGEKRRVQDERDRIARELHDVVAHHMSVIAVRSVSASRRIPGLPTAAAEEFGELGAAAREALGEMRQMLGVLRADATPALEPQPGLGDLPRLAERTSSAGTPVQLSVTEPQAMSMATAVSAYRIVQEALSNVTRHATGAATTVHVAASEDGASLVVEVANEPSPNPARRRADPGHGLAGMRERAHLLGGVLAAGPTPAGGYRVRAELPLGPAT